MKLFAQFYDLCTGYPSFKEEDKKPIEACGDRSIIIIDGRLSISYAEEIARKECEKRKYIGYSIHKGENFLRSTEIIKYTPLNEVAKNT